MTMDVFDIVITVIMGFLLLWAGFIFIRNPKVIIFSYLRGMKNSYWEMQIVFLPIWGTAWILDKVFNWGIFEEGER